jgi:hypothetical protein
VRAGTGARWWLASPAAWRGLRLAAAMMVVAACADFITGPTALTDAQRVPRALALSASTLSLIIGQSQQLVATVLDQEGNAFATAPAGIAVLWKTSDATRATVDATGLVTALRAGQVAVSAVLATDIGQVTVQAGVAIRGHPAKITVSAGSAQTATVATVLPISVKVTVVDANGDPVPNITVQFSGDVANGSTSPASAVTDATGSAATAWTLGHLAGQETIQVTAMDDVAQVTLPLIATALPGLLASAHVSPATVLFATLGRTAPLAYALVDKFGNPTSATSTLQWISRTPGVASVDAAGNVTALSNGTTYVTVVGLPADSALVTVKQFPVLVSVKAAPATVAVGQTSTATATVTDSAGSPVLGAPVTWTVEPPTAGTIGSIGVFLAQQAGSATLRGTIAGGLSGTAVVAVTAAPALQIIIVNGDNQTGAPGARLNNSIAVTVVDALGHCVNNIPITFTPVVPNGGQVAPGSGKSDCDSGELDAFWTMPPVANAHPQVVASITGSSVTFHATTTPGAPVGITRQWLGGTNTDWNTASNWIPAGVPGPTDSVVILNATAHLPVLATNTTIRALVLSDGTLVSTVLQINAHDTLTVAGDVYVSLSAIPYGITGSGVLVMTGVNSHLQGLMYFINIVIKGSVTATFKVYTLGDMTLQGGTLTLGGFSVTINNFTADATSALVMTDPRDHLQASIMQFNRTPERGKLTAGTIQAYNLTGFYTPSDSINGTDFYAGPSHTLLMVQADGGEFGTSSCACATTAMTFGNVIVTGPAYTYTSGPVRLSGNLTVSGSATTLDIGIITGALTVAGTVTVRNGAILSGFSLVAGGDLQVDINSSLVLLTLEVQAPSGTQNIVGPLHANDVYFNGTNQAIQARLDYPNVHIVGSAHLTGTTYATLLDLQVSGTLTFAGNFLNVIGPGGSLGIVTQKGAMVMTLPGDSLRVYGNLALQGTPASQYSAGRIIAFTGGNVVVGGAGGSYVASGSHTLVVRSPAVFNVQATLVLDPTDHVSRFQNLVADTGATVMIVDATVPVQGVFRIAQAAVVLIDSTTKLATGSIVLEDGAFLGYFITPGEIGYCTTLSVAPTARIYSLVPIHTCGPLPGAGAPVRSVVPKRPVIPVWIPPSRKPR